MKITIRRKYQTRQFSARIRPLAYAMALSFSAGSGAALAADAFSLAQEPLTSGSGVSPNLLYIHDNSGSMYYSFMPDLDRMTKGGYDSGAPASLKKIHHAKKLKSPQVNTIYYDPAQNYPPPPAPPGTDIKDAKGNLVTDGTLGNADFNDAWYDGYDIDGRNGSGNYYEDSSLVVERRVDLGTEYKATFSYSAYYHNDPKTPYKAEYLPADGTSNMKAHYYNCGSVDLDKDDCGAPVYIDTSNAAEKQNFANWYSYYRRRNYVARAGLARAFGPIGDEFRLGWGAINHQSGNNVTDMQLSDIEGVRSFDTARKADFLKWLYRNKNAPNGTRPYGSTPLRNALNIAGQYYETKKSPWQDDPTSSSSGMEGAECRKSFTILMTDGYWNGGDPSVGNQDGPTTESTYPTPADPNGQTKTWSKKPFSDGVKNTLADVAWKYWRHDLRTDIDNRVPETKVDSDVRDPAFWQHMTTYTIGLGVAPEVITDVAAVWAAQATETTQNATSINWGGVEPSEHQIDDLFHAAVNGHGGFASAKDPQEFTESMKTFLDQIRGTVPIAPLGVTSGALRSNSFLYEATYDTNWNGALSGYQLCLASEVTSSSSPCQAEGDTVEPASWKATIPAAADRNIYLCGRSDASPACTLTSPTTAAPTVFGWPQQDVGAAEWAKLRANFGRDEHAVGTIINSGPLYVENEDYNYGSWGSLSSDERSAYVTTRAKRDRPAVVYVGSNDGMLHAFKAAESHNAPGSGKELFAYIPNAVFPNLKKLFDPNAAHHFFVDGSPTAGDANLGTSTSPDWSTVLVGSTGAGGKGYFALDVENPAQPKPLWEAGPDVSGFENLGATLGQASIVRMQSGEWVAIFGNGYNAADNKAHLYIVNLKSGALIKDILLANSADETASGNTAPNGLSTPLSADKNRDGSVDTVYVGDMLGNLWKIDLSATSSGGWPSSLSTPLFKATDDSGNTQPIYAKPAAMLRANTTNEVLVFFGTGKFFEKRDAEGNGHDDYTDLSVQTFYGVKDTDSSGPPLTRASLAVQTIHKAPASVGNYDAAELRYLSNNPVSYDPGGQSGFYIDLTVGGVKQGERVTSSPILLHDRVIFTTLVPTPPEGGNICNTGSTHGWLMQVTLTGGQPDNSVFDLNRDGAFDEKDESGSEVVGGVRVENSGIVLTSRGGGTTDPADPAAGPGNPPNSGICDGRGSSKTDAHTAIACPSSGQGRESWQQLKGR